MDLSKPIQIYQQMIILLVFLSRQQNAVTGQQDCFTQSFELSYQGTASTTPSGPCQAWNDQRIFSDSGGTLNRVRQQLGNPSHNFCRNPSVAGDITPWCYLSGSFQPDAKSQTIRWDHCNVTVCEECYRPSTLYRGSASKTERNQDCMYWNDTRIKDPHGSLEKTRRELVNTEGTYDHNFCRNPQSIADEPPWCYVNAAIYADTPNNQRWHFCSVKSCPTTRITTRIRTTTTPTTVKPFSTINGDCYRDAGKYRGTVSKTIEGRECLQWNDRNILHDSTLDKIRMELLASENSLSHNHCRNPIAASRLRPWCYIKNATWSNMNEQFQYCDVPHCTNIQETTRSILPLVVPPEKPIVDPQQIVNINCYRNLGLYRGHVSTTKHGYRCLKWNDQRIVKPQILHPVNNPYGNVLEGVRQELLDSEGTIDHNYCRNPKYAVKDAKPWCYIENATWSTLNGRYDFCDVPHCYDSCDLAEPLPNGNLLSNCTGRPNHQCSFKCDAGFTTNSISVTCNSTLIWSPPLKDLCVGTAHQCPSNIPNGELIWAIGDECKRANKDTCEFRCTTLGREGELYCNKGRWELVGHPTIGINQLCDKATPAKVFISEATSSGNLTLITVCVTCVVIVAIIALLIGCICQKRHSKAARSNIQVSYGNAGASLSDEAVITTQSVNVVSPPNTVAALAVGSDYPPGLVKERIPAKPPLYETVIESDLRASNSVSSSRCQGSEKMSRFKSTVDWDDSENIYDQVQTTDENPPSYSDINK